MKNKEWFSFFNWFNFVENKGGNHGKNRIRFTPEEKPHIVEEGMREGASISEIW